MSFLISLSEAKAFMQVTTTSTDSLISSYIDLVEGEIVGIVGRPLALATYTELPRYGSSNFDHSNFTPLDTGFNSPNLFLKNYPAYSLSIADVSTSQYSYVTESGIISGYLSEPTATYVAGYTTVTAPYDLKLVALMGVTSFYQNNAMSVSGNRTVKSKKIKDFSVEYADSGMRTYITNNMSTLSRYQSVNL